MSWTGRATNIAMTLIAGALVQVLTAGPVLAQQAAAPSVLLSSSYAGTAASQSRLRDPAPGLERLVPSALPSAEGPNSWACVEGAKLDFMPVSFDNPEDRGADTWVVVYSYRNEVVASERVSKSDVDRIKRQSCAPAPSVRIG